MIEQRVRSFIVEELDWDGDPNSLTKDYPLIRNNVIDSMGLFELVSFVEQEFDVEVRDEELVPGNFATIGDIVRFVESRRPS